MTWFDCGFLWCQPVNWLTFRQKTGEREKTDQKKIKFQFCVILIYNYNSIIGLDLDY